MILVSAPSPQDRRYARADACDVIDSVEFDGEVFDFDCYSVYEDNRGNAEWTYYFVSPSGRWAASGRFDWSVTA